MVVAVVGVDLVVVGVAPAVVIIVVVVVVVVVVVLCPRMALRAVGALS